MFENDMKWLSFSIVIFTDINDCLGVICENGGSCIDNLGSYTCSCSKGFTGKNCEKDVNECAGFLHGGCEDICINTVGSFHCKCSGNTTLNSDGISCAGGENVTSIFARHGIVRKLLPRGCSTILLTRCTDGNTVDVFMSSTSPWYKLRSNNSIIYTFGIVFVEVNTLSLPVSISGIEIVRSNDNFAIVTGSLAFNDNDGIAYGEDRKLDCVTFSLTPRDIRDFLTSSSFMRSVFANLEDVLPDWLKFSQTGTDILSVNDLQTQLLQGKEIQTGKCRGAPTHENRLYTVLKFGSSFSISLYGDEVEIPKMIRNEQFCLIIDICQDYGGSLFLIIPEESRGLLNNIGMIYKFRQKYGIEIQPVGVGLSLFRHINVRYSATSLRLWKGDEYFTYRIMPEANLWVGGGATWSLKGDKFSAVVKANSNIFMSVPSPQNILKSVFLREWNAYLKLNLLGSISLTFKLFGKSQTLTLRNAGAADIEAYASLGGQTQRTWCGKDANPAGMFTSLLVDVNPFREVPILKHGLFDFSNRIYVYFATNPTPTVNTANNIDIIHDIIDLKGMTEIFINTTVENVFRYSSLLVNQSVVMLSHLQNSARQLTTSLENFVQELNKGEGNIISHLVGNISTIWNNGWKRLRKDAENFLDSIEHNTVVAKYNFTRLIYREIDHLKENIQNVIDKITAQIMHLFENPQGFGVRYKGSLKIFFLKIAGLEIELVYSVDRLGTCGRFSKVYELLRGERAARIYAVVSTGLVKLAPFLRMHVGYGIGIAMSIDTPGKMIAQLHAEASVLGISGNVDVFLTQTGHYFIMQGKVWNTFMAELTVLFESAGNGIESFNVRGRLLANAGEGDSFESSYLDGLRKITRKFADEANRRISSVQNAYSTAQRALTKAQDWLEEKKVVIQSANKAFDKAVQSLEHAKDKLEEAKIPFRNALNKLNEAQRKVDGVCKIRDCRRICVPGLKCRICWKKVWFVKIPYPCCHFTSCMFSFPDPICVAINLGCRAVRAIAYLALEAAKVFVRIPMLALDAAKLLVSGAQFVVDKSRAVLDIATGALDLAQLGLEGVKGVLEGAKYSLEAVKKVVGWGLRALDFIIKYGIQSIIDVRNCGFEMKVSVYDSTVFHVQCEINLFRQGFKYVKLGVNFGNPIQSIWQAAKGTIDTFVDVTRLSEKKKRDIKSEAMSGLHKVIRETRNADMTSDDFDLYINDTIDTIFSTSGFKRNVSAGDYENRVEMFLEKCVIMRNAMSFFTEAVQVLFEMANETAKTLNNASSLDESLGGFNIDDIASNFSIENIGVNTDAALNDFNMSVEDIEGAMQEAKNNLTNDPLLSGIDGLSKEAKACLKNQIEDANNIKLVNHWLLVMENATSEYFNEESCISFLDCAHFAVYQLYGLFDAENVTNMSRSLKAISQFEDLFLELTGNASQTVVEVYDLTQAMITNLKEINDYDVFCSEPPKLLSQIANQSVTEGSILRLYCNVTGNPPPQIWWFREDQYLPEQTGRILEINNISKTDGKKYRCVAGNLVANLSSDFTDVFVSEDAPVVTTQKPSSLKSTDAAFIGKTTYDIYTTDKSVVRKGVNKDSDDSTSLAIILCTTIPALGLIVVIGVVSAWRIQVRKRARKADSPGSITSLNMVRPVVHKPVINTKVIAFEAPSK
ncbi:uncharacterized protein LOC123527162 [Mercenaria mercenaria]|uniref:uncharacterized protein LOC123527162 n=1 Tax=Mercenaria mercenaria TaxID=6596 RepID=UPI00234EFBA8|nr:uncharacterized protein LOC123527162 [Mercenaria mercenaria]